MSDERGSRQLFRRQARTDSRVYRKDGTAETEIKGGSIWGTRNEVDKDGVKNKPDYANLRIAHGKDRCANPPRSGPQGGMRRSASGGTMATPMSAVEHDVDAFSLIKSEAVTLGEDLKDSADSSLDLPKVDASI